MLQTKVGALTALLVFALMISTGCKPSEKQLAAQRSAKILSSYDSLRIEAYKYIMGPMVSHGKNATSHLMEFESEADTMSTDLAIVTGKVSALIDSMSAEKYSALRSKDRGLIDYGRKVVVVLNTVAHVQSDFAKYEKVMNQGAKKLYGLNMKCLGYLSAADRVSIYESCATVVFNNSKAHDTYRTATIQLSAGVIMLDSVFITYPSMVNTQTKSLDSALVTFNGWNKKREKEESESLERLHITLEILKRQVFQPQQRQPMYYWNNTYPGM